MHKRFNHSHIYLKIVELYQKSKIFSIVESMSKVVENVRNRMDWKTTKKAQNRKPIDLIH